MRILLIAYEHHSKLPYDYSNFFDKIKEFSHAKVTERGYLIKTTMSPKKIYKELRKSIGSKGDTLIVMSISKIYKGHGPENLMDWISRNIHSRPIGVISRFFRN